MRIRFELVLSKLGFEQRGRTLLRFALRDVNRREGHHRRDTSIQHFQPDVAVVFRQGFEQAVAEHGRAPRSRVSCWGQFVAMLFCTPGGRSPCGICADCRQRSKLRTWGADAPSASPWPMHEHRPWQLYRACFINCWAAAAKLPVRMASASKPTAEPGRTLIELCANVFDWARRATVETKPYAISALLSKTSSY